MLGRLKILQNEKYVVYDSTGKISIKEGPGNFFVYNSNYRRLGFHTIDKTNFLKVTFLDGRIIHVPGPTTFWENPIEHLSIKEERLWEISTSDTVLSYINEDDKITPNFIKGYTLYLPKVNETWVKTLKRYSASPSQYIETLKKDGRRLFIQGPSTILENPMEDTETQIKNMRNIPSNQGLMVYREENNKVEPIFIHGPAQYMPKGNEYISREIVLISATPNQYIEIFHQDGNVDYIPGPYEVWENPIKYKSILVRDSIEVATNECIVVYKEDKGKILRNIHYGPILYHPTGKEWTHTFKWHGSDPKHPTKKIYGALQFQKLRLIPDQIFLEIELARTMDDAPLVIKLMLFFELVDPGIMIDKTHDPIADFMNSTTADVLEFVGKYTFEEFKKHINDLSELKNYHQLILRSKGIGYDIHKVVFRGYISSTALEQMHNNAIEVRTKLVLDQETEYRAQSLEDFKLEKEKIRQNEVLNLKRLENEHNNNLDKANHNVRLEKAKSESDQKIKIEKENFENIINKEEKLKSIELEHLKKKNELELNKNKESVNIEISKYNKLKEMNVDLSSYMVALAKGKPDQWIQLENSNDKATPHIHIQKL